jgi:hypothetical protein
VTAQADATDASLPQPGKRQGAVRGLPAAWRDPIVSSVTEAVGAARVFLIGSRATGEAHPWSDCDVTVVVPSRKIVMAARRLQPVAATLSRDFGVPVSVNPVPKWLFDRAHHNLYMLKVRTEGIHLNGDASVEGDVGLELSGGCETWRVPGVAEWDAGSLLARCAEVSYLMSAVHTLLEGVDPAVLIRASLDAGAEAALQKAKVQVAQCCLLARGQYVAAAPAAVMMAEQLGLVPAGLSGVDCFIGLRQRLLRVLGPNPVTGLGVRSAARDLQYVALSTLRGRRRWPILCRDRGIEGRLASASLHLLQSLSGEQPSGYDASLVLKASSLLPAGLRPQSQEYEAVRDVILSEWSSAQPLAGIVP